MPGPILVLGEALIDEVHRQGDVAQHPGGSPMNVAVGLARLDNDVHLLSQWGGDADGDRIEQHLTSSGVVIVPGTRSTNPTSRAIATIDETGAANYEFHVTWDPQSSATLDGVSHAHTGSISTVITPGANKVAEMIESLASSATVSVDPNARPSLMGDPAEAYERISRIIANADIVKASDEDIAWLTKDTDERDVVEQWLAGGAAIVVVTRGADGVSAYCAAGEVSSPTLATEVADTVGAGDSLMGGLIDGLNRLGLLGAANRDALNDVSLIDLTEVITWASAISAITVSRDGANPPTTAEVRTFLSEHDISTQFADR
ncbi:hypothetical protein BSZ39_07015 [Bowdeniella nasicola]|uniref:Carbohydrate kinase PfkB domain-containing protein n=2 Tax=Bowdeniella nasicola TaxID=208480 RepID=A0A1Q5Q1Y8_9ACTO|nr:hypothetical protein BSZ39_07015 [Bowdeniella nasicola]